MQVLKNASRDDVLEHALKAKEEAIEINYRLENENMKLKDEIKQLNKEINKLAKENKELEEMKAVLFRLVYYFSKRELEE